MTFEVRFEFGDKVWIDEDDSITATVTGFVFRKRDHDVEVSWMANAAMQTVWVSDYRLSPAKLRWNPPPPASDVGGLQKKGI